MQIHRMGGELFHADGQTGRQTDENTDITKLIVAFLNFANALKKKKEGKELSQGKAGGNIRCKIQFS